MPKIFLSYRREDSQGLTGRIFDRLAPHFGINSVFMDVDTIPPGVDFRQHLSKAVAECDVFLAVIGDRWLSASQDGRRRLDDVRDFVRIEVEAALLRGIPVVPLLVGRTHMPREDELPDSLKLLAFRNAAMVDPGRDFHLHIDRLIVSLDKLIVKKLRLACSHCRSQLKVAATSLGKKVKCPKCKGVFHVRKKKPASEPTKPKPIAPPRPAPASDPPSDPDIFELDFDVPQLNEELSDADFMLGNLELEEGDEGSQVVMLDASEPEPELESDIEEQSPELEIDEELLDEVEEEDNQARIPKRKRRKKTGRFRATKTFFTLLLFVGAVVYALGFSDIAWGTTILGPRIAEEVSPWLRSCIACSLTLDAMFGALLLLGTMAALLDSREVLRTPVWYGFLFLGFAYFATSSFVAHRLVMSELSRLPESIELVPIYMAILPAMLLLMVASMITLRAYSDS